MKTCAGTVTAALFMIMPNWRQPKCPSAGEQINKPECVYFSGINSVIK